MLLSEVKKLSFNPQSKDCLMCACYLIQALMQRLPSEFHDIHFAYACACSVDAELAQQGMVLLSQIVMFNQDLGDWPRIINTVAKLWGSK